jgi:hypothetical protein
LIFKEELYDYKLPKLPEEINVYLNSHSIRISNLYYSIYQYFKEYITPDDVYSDLIRDMEQYYLIIHFHDVESFNKNTLFKNITRFKDFEHIIGYTVTETSSLLSNINKVLKINIDLAQTDDIEMRNFATQCLRSSVTYQRIIRSYSRDNPGEMDMIAKVEETIIDKLTDIMYSILLCYSDLKLKKQSLSIYKSE